MTIGAIISSASNEAAKIIASCRRGFARMWEWLKNRFTWKRKKNPAWGTEPRDDVHALYRERFERFAEGMPHLPRTKTNETTEAFLAVSQTAQMLHEYGDDPIRVPETGRIIRPDDRLATFGAVGQPMGVMAGFSGVSGWVMAALAAAAVTGWGGTMLQTARLDAEEAKHARTKDDYAMVARTNDSLRETNAELAEMVSAADQQTRATAALVEAERQRRLRAEADARRIRNAMDQARAGGPVDYGFGSVPDAAVGGAGAPPAGGGAAARRNPN